MANPAGPDFAASAAGVVVFVSVSSVYLRVKPHDGSYGHWRQYGNPAQASSGAATHLRQQAYLGSSDTPQVSLSAYR